MDNTRKCGAPGCERPATRELSDSATKTEDVNVRLVDAADNAFSIPMGTKITYTVRVCDQHELADVPGAGFTREE